MIACSMPILDQFGCEQFKWVDLSDPTAAEIEELAAQYGLNQNIIRDCMEPEHLPKYERIGDLHFLILRYYAHSFHKKMGSIQELTDKIAVFYNDGVLITIHKSEVSFLRVMAKNISESQNCGSTTELITRIVWQVLASFDDPADRLSEQVDFFETQVMVKKTAHDLMEELYYIKRQASLTAKVILLTTEPIHHIYIKPGEESFLQDIKDEHLKMQTLYSGIVEEVNNLLNLSLSFATQRTNEVMRVLTIFSVFFMPLTFIVGIYGMNFHYMPELKQPWAYPAVMIVMALVTLWIYLRFRRKRWL